jgi:hypothetical protein
MAQTLIKAATTTDTARAATWPHADRDRLRDMGFRQAAEFTWAVAAASTLDVYREVAERRRRRRA